MSRTWRIGPDSGRVAPRSACSRGEKRHRCAAAFQRESLPQAGRGDRPVMGVTVRCQARSPAVRIDRAGPGAARPAFSDVPRPPRDADEPNGDCADGRGDDNRPARPEAGWGSPPASDDRDVRASAKGARRLENRHVRPARVEPGAREPVAPASAPSPSVTCVSAE